MVAVKAPIPVEPWKPGEAAPPASVIVAPVNWKVGPAPRVGQAGAGDGGVQQPGAEIGVEPDVAPQHAEIA